MRCFLPCFQPAQPTPQNTSQQPSSSVVDLDKAIAESEAYRQVSTRQEATIPQGQVVTLGEWGVTAKNDSTHTLRYKISDNNKSVYLTSSELVAATPRAACGIGSEGTNQYMGGGRISRYAADDDVVGPGSYTAQKASERAVAYDENGVAYKKVGNYYYFYFPSSDNGCTGSAEDDQTKAAQPVEKKTTEAVKALLATFAAEQ